MNIEQCIILAAGFGTRMGPIGKKLPKVMWPLFEYSLLESQILFAKSLGIKKIYINTHHQAELIKISSKVNENISVQLIHEEDILGSGGGIHNILNQSDIDKKKPVLILNSDVFYMIDTDSIKEALTELDKNKNIKTILFPVKCNKNDSYNRLRIENKKLKEIIPKNVPSEFNTTYSGVSICHPDRLENSKGESAFFTTIANYKNEDVFVAEDRGWEYWDFGTYNLYHKEIFKTLHKALDKKNSTFVNYLLEQNIIIKENLNFKTRSYKSIDLETLCFLNNQFKVNSKEIIYGEVRQII